MLRFGLFGAGRIGSMHARNLAANPRVELAYVYDVDEPAARKAAEGAGARVAPDITTILTDAAVDAVLIASPTNTHVDLIAQAAQAGKAVLCEKPIDLDITRANRCRDQIADCEVAIQIRLQPPLRSQSQCLARSGSKRRNRADRETHHHQSRPCTATRRLREGFRRPVPRHDDP